MGDVWSQYVQIGNSSTQISSTFRMVNLQTQKNSKQYTNVDVIPCDATKETDILDLASKTKVLINCVGPYRIYGEKIVAACVETSNFHLKKFLHQKLITSM